MLEQMKRLGYSFDYDRVFYSSDESQYRWSQWLFVTLLEAGLVYRDDATVDWCDSCQTTLAALQVEDGRCWRCHNEVRLIRRPTWFLRVTPYLEENDANLERARALGRALAENPALHPRPHRRGRARAGRPGGGRSTVFTPHRDAVGEARFVLVSPRHPEVERWAAGRGGPLAARRAALGRLGAQRPRRRGGAGDRHRRLACRPRRGELPVFVSPIVDARFGPTAVLGIPAVDEADEAIAERMPRAAAEGGGPGAGDGEAREAKRYRASDFSIGRQRYWGTPIPIVNCESCGRCRSRSRSCRWSCPRDIEPTGEGNPLAERPDFVDVACPRCGRAGQARDRHARLPLRRALALGARRGAARGPRRADVQPPRPAALAARRAPGRRRRQRQLRLRPARRHQGAARHRPARLPRGRRALRRLPLPRDGHRRRAQDEQAPRQRRRPRRAGRQLRRRHRAPGDPLRGGPGEDAELERRRDALRRAASSTASGTTRSTASPRSRRRPSTRRRKPTPSSCASAWSNGAPTASPGSPPTSRSCRCTRRCATSPASSSGSRTSRSAWSSAAGSSAAPTPRRWSTPWSCSGRVLAPFAPHFAEGLLIEAGREDDVESLSPWPQPVESLS